MVDLRYMVRLFVKCNIVYTPANVEQQLTIFLSQVFFVFENKYIVKVYFKTKTLSIDNEKCIFPLFNVKVKFQI